MGYLVLNDYKTYIQGDYLRQLLQGDDSKRVTEENSAVQEIVGRLTQRYDLDAEFTETLPYDNTVTYGAGSRITIDYGTKGFKAWAANTAYSVYDLVIYNEVGYSCNTANSDATFNLSNWDVIASRHTIWYGAYPSSCTLNGQSNPATLTSPYAPVFNYKSTYSKGDVVFWKGYTYVCNQASTTITHQQALQYTTIGQVPFGNVFPDDPVANEGGAYWNQKTAYSIPAGLLNDQIGDGLWIKGDNRNQRVKDAMVILTVFKLSPTLAPMNRPQAWMEDFRCTLNDLNEAALGRTTWLLPLKQPTSGLKTRYGGDIKRQNNY